MSQRWTIRVVGGTVLFVLLAVTAFVFAPKAQGGQTNAADSRIQAGLAAAPVPLNMAGKNPALVGLGSYIVNVSGDCNGDRDAGLRVPQRRDRGDVGKETPQVPD